MKNTLDSYGHIIGLSAFGVTLFLLLVGLSNLYICCSPDRRTLRYRIDLLLMMVVTIVKFDFINLQLEHIVYINAYLIISQLYQKLPHL